MSDHRDLAHAPGRSTNLHAARRPPAPTAGRESVGAGAWWLAGIPQYLIAGVFVGADAGAWGLAQKDEGVSAWELGDGKDETSYARTYDGMNWEAGGESPIISVLVHVWPPPRAGASEENAPSRRGEVAAPGTGLCGSGEAFYRSVIGSTAPSRTLSLPQTRRPSR